MLDDPIATLERELVDPADIGGLAELKWVAEHAYMHSILMAPHGTANGLLGLGALISGAAALVALDIAAGAHPVGGTHAGRIPPPFGSASFHVRGT